ncbi:hypothetical protein ACFL96_03145 [Thermoproteota archaeon]
MTETLKQNLLKMITDTNKTLSMTKQAEADIAKMDKKAAEKLLNSIIAMSTQELKKLNKSFKGLKLDDKKIISIMNQLTEECRRIMQLARELIHKIGDKKFISGEHKNQIMELFRNIETLEKKQAELEQSFFSMKKVDFENVLEQDPDIGKLPKGKTKAKIREIRTRFDKYNHMTDIQKAMEFKKLVDSMGAERAQKYFNKLMFFLRRGNDVTSKLVKADPNNTLLQEDLDITYEEPKELEVTVPKNIKILFPKVGFPRGADFAFILTHGMLFTIFVASLTGNIWTAAFAFIGGASGIVTLAVVSAIALWFVRRRLKRFPDIGKRTANLIAYIAQKGDLNLIYNTERILPEPAEVKG